MRIAGLQKLTLLDYPGKTAATIFVAGCDFRCPFCHNAQLVLNPTQSTESLSETDVLAFLEKRHGLLDGVCITGGEPCLQPDLPSLCARIHEAGFLVKLDTNGSLPDALKPLLEEHLVDCVAMDVKNTPARYAETVGVSEFDISPVRESIRLITESGCAHEFRTTVARELHSEDDLRTIAKLLPPASPWYLQSFIDGDEIIGGTGSFSAYDESTMRELVEILRETHRATFLRGVN